MSIPRAAFAVPMTSRAFNVSNTLIPTHICLFMRDAVGPGKYFVVVCIVAAFGLTVGLTDVTGARNFSNGSHTALFCIV